ncbi:hypothetical protein OS187_06830 [Xanthomonadaceae bacterium JHOS43]|nr:hypothetical protein [Xanthomonadaceae bacterium JHOS43]MCX7562968.1 hypothetical protein [Xanthomonadaceae bacterium XH05]
MRKNTIRLAAAAMMLPLLAGCGGSRESQAAAACEAAARERSEGKMLEVDRKVLAQGATSESGDILRLQAPVTFDTGLQSEYTQTLECRVQISNGQVRVIGIQFLF